MMLYVVACFLSGCVVGFAFAVIFMPKPRIIPYEQYLRERDAIVRARASSTAMMGWALVGYRLNADEHARCVAIHDRETPKLQPMAVIHSREDHPVAPTTTTTQ